MEELSLYIIYIIIVAGDEGNKIKVSRDHGDREIRHSDKVVRRSGEGGRFEMTGKFHI